MKLKDVRVETSRKEKLLRESTTWMKYHVIKFSVNRLLNQEASRITERHQMKLDKLIVKKRIQDGITENPNNLITNLTGEDLVDEDIDALKFGLRYSVAMRPSEAEMLTVMENLWDQISQKSLEKDPKISSSRIKSALRSFTYNYLDIDDKRYGLDKKRITVIRRLKEKYVILKPDKGQGIVLMNIGDYKKSVENLFSDETKFKRVSIDPTIGRTATLKSYLNKLRTRNEIDDELKDKMSPRAAHVSRVHALPKIHKAYTGLPKMRPIIDTTGSPYYGVGQYLSSLLQPLTMNEYTVRDSFEAAEKIRGIPSEFFDQDYVFISFDVESLFTNVPLHDTVNIILERVYKEKLLDTNLSKRSLKKLILDSCQKTTFTFDSTLYEQIEGVSMGASCGPVLANIILTELEKRVVHRLFDDDLIKFYMRYVDDTLVLIKRRDIEYVLSRLNSFHPNLRFTVDRFEDNNVHFLDLRINNNSTNIYYKDTHTGQYIHFTSYTPWKFRIAWVQSLYHRALKICSNDTYCQEQISNIRKFMSWNGFPNYVIKSLLSRLEKNSTRINKDENTDTQTLCLTLPYAGEKGEMLVRSCFRKIRRYLKSNVKIIIRYNSKKLSFLCSTKDKIPVEQRSNVIYQITCPGCGEKYVGKTNRCLKIRMTEQGTRFDQPMYRHLSSCTEFTNYVKLFALPDLDRNSTSVSLESHKLNAVLNNHCILDNNSYRLNWNQLLFLEGYYIKKKKPLINQGLKASKEFILFA